MLLKALRWVARIWLYYRMCLGAEDCLEMEEGPMPDYTELHQQARRLEARLWRQAFED